VLLAVDETKIKIDGDFLTILAVRLDEVL